MTDVGAPRPAPVDREPGTRLGRTLQLLDEVDGVVRALGPLLRMVERTTGIARDRLTELLAQGAAQDVGALARGTDADRAALEQVQGLRVRIADTLLAGLDERHLDEIRRSLRRVGSALEQLTAGTHEGPRPGSVAHAATEAGHAAAPP